MDDVISSWEDLMDPNVEEPRYGVVKIGTRNVRVASVSAAEIIEFIEANDDPANRNDNTLRLIARSVVDKDGKRIGKIDELAKLKDKAPTTLIKLRDKCLEVNGLVVKKDEAPLKNDSREEDTPSSRIDSPSDEVSST